MLVFRALDVLELAQADLHALRGVADIDDIGRVGSRSACPLDQRDGPVAGGFERQVIERMAYWDRLRGKRRDDT